MMGNIIDLRSDTVTIPTEKMRRAMFEAEVGDDVYGDDPTVNKLEDAAAKRFGMESALFVPSGTMGNQLALFTHVQRGEEVILPDNCHVVVHEVAAASIISGAQLRCIQTINGEMPLDVIEHTIRKDLDDIHIPKTSLITYENAASDGTVRSVSYMAEIKALADKYQLPVHIDGARIFNAAVALKTDVKTLANYFDSISVCLSKGLCAPVGSILIGKKDFIAKARKKRKLLGGGMRQAGFLAAAGLIALEEMTERLQEDHDNALYLAEKLSKIPGLRVCKDMTQINMVFFALEQFPMDGTEMAEYLKKHNILINGAENGLMRFVTNYYVTREDIDTVVSLIKVKAGI